jgi:hypothetical protein
MPQELALWDHSHVSIYQLLAVMREQTRSGQPMRASSTNSCSVPRCPNRFDTGAARVHGHTSTAMRRTGCHIERICADGGELSGASCGCFPITNNHCPSAFAFANPAGSASFLSSSQSGRGSSKPSSTLPYVIPPSRLKGLNTYIIISIRPYTHLYHGNLR